MNHIDKFSDSTLAYLSQDWRKQYYIYCLVDERNGEVFYVGKGRDNHIFMHESYALGFLSHNPLETEEFTSDLQVERINEIIETGHRVRKVILNYGLSSSQARASEQTLLNFFNLMSKNKLSNPYNIQGVTVETLEKRYGYQPMKMTDIQTDELIMAVKVKDSINLSTNEAFHYPLNDRDDANLKSRTLGDWLVSDDQIARIRYIIGIDLELSNAVVSAYAIDRSRTEGQLAKVGRIRYAFYSNSNSEDVLKHLGLYKRSLPELSFGMMGSTVYID